MKSDVSIESIFQLNSEIKFENLKDESLDINLAACSVIPLVRSSSLLEYLSHEESYDYEKLNSKVGLADFLSPTPCKDFESKKNKRKLSQPKKADNRFQATDDKDFNDVTEIPHTNVSTSDTSLIYQLKQFINSASSEPENNKIESPPTIDIQPPKPRIVYLCHNCNICFTSRLDFEKHYKDVYKKNPIYTCQICNKQMENMRSFRGHYYRHTTALKFQCEKCPKKFMNQQLLAQHETVHKIDIQYKCGDCNQFFSDDMEYKQHRREHKKKDIDKTKESKWKCPDCGKLLMNRSSLFMHTKIHKDRQYECSVCPQKFVQKINLINHIKTHTGDKPYSCQECGKRFVGISQLHRHNTYHLNVRSCKCETCGKMYKSERDLKLHQMVHSEQRPHACSYCDKTFLSTSKLKQHYNIHTGARPFKCKYCSKDFTNFPNWLKHIRRRHKVDHKTGKQLEQMPNFLNKEKKEANKTSVNENTKVKVKKTKIPKKSISKDDIVTDKHKSTVTIVKNELNLSNENQINKLFTIPPDDETLPLNTSDDLERAAAIIMQQALDMEDDEMQRNLNGAQPKTTMAIDELIFSSELNSEHEVFSIHAASSSSPYISPVFSFQPQCDVSLMTPLPPINTIKIERNLIDHSTHLFPTNVL